MQVLRHDVQKKHGLAVPGSGGYSCHVNSNLILEQYSCFAADNKCCRVKLTSDGNKEVIERVQK